MKNNDLISDKHLIFASLLMIANRMDTLLTRELKEFNVTTKQWFLLATIESLFDNPPTMKSVAWEMGCSYQNIKQVALILQRKGLLKLGKDQRDARVTRLEMTDQSYAFLQATQPSGEVFMEDLFKDIEKEDLAKAKAVLEKILFNLTEMKNPGT